MTSEKLRIGLLLLPKLTQLDLTGPAEVFMRMPAAETLLIWKRIEPVSSDRGLSILPTATFESCGRLDVICVPGGPGQVDLMEDEETLAFLREKAAEARLVTSVCTGSLLLGAAGLLQGRRATCHWASIDQLALLGATPVHERVVRDGNRITGAGVTSGVDFALTVAAELLGPQAAQEIQLQMEYDPEPPFETGSPRSAPSAMVEAARARIAPFIAKRRAASERAGAKLSRS